jgi:large subunit ribosomal protein L14
VVVAIKDAIPGAGVKKGDVAKAVVVRAVSEGRRKDGRTSASTNAVVLINDDELPAHAHLRSVVASRA